ncbi:MAG: hypothetical protein ABW032_04625, partial [Burkholderiaceae bacterium]
MDKPTGTAPSWVQRHHVAWIDVVDLFRWKDDVQFRHQIGADTESAPGEYDFGPPDFKAQDLEHLHQAIENDLARTRPDGTPIYSDKQRRTIQHRIDESRTEMNEMVHGIKGAKWYVTRGVALGARLLNTFLPIYVPAASKSAPELGPDGTEIVKPDPQGRGVALISASYLKSWSQTIRQVLDPTAGNGRTGNRTMQRDLANEVQSVLLLINVIDNPGVQKVAHDLLKFNLPVAVAGFGILMSAYSLGDFFKEQKDQYWGPGYLPGKLEYSNKELRRMAAASPHEARAAAISKATDVKHAWQCLQDTRDLFKAQNIVVDGEGREQVQSGGELGDAFNWKVGTEIDRLKRLEVQLLALGGRTKEKEKKPKNPQKYSKLLMTGMYGAFLLAPFIPVTGAFLKYKEMVPEDEANNGVGNKTEPEDLLRRGPATALPVGLRDVPVARVSPAVQEDPHADALDYIQSLTRKGEDGRITISMPAETGKNEPPRGARRESPLQPEDPVLPSGAAASGEASGKPLGRRDRLARKDIHSVTFTDTVKYLASGANKLGKLVQMRSPFQAWGAGSDVDAAKGADLGNPTIGRYMPRPPSLAVRSPIGDPEIPVAQVSPPAAEARSNLMSDIRSRAGKTGRTITLAVDTRQRTDRPEAPKRGIVQARSAMGNGTDIDATIAALAANEVAKRESASQGNNSTRMVEVEKSSFETIPAVDLGIDFCISMVNLIRDTFKGHKDLQDLIETGSAWVGLSFVMAIDFGIGVGVKGPKFAETPGDAEWTAATIGLIIGNMTVATAGGVAALKGGKNIKKLAQYAMSDKPEHEAKGFMGVLMHHYTAFKEYLRQGNVAAAKKELERLGRHAIDRTNEAEEARRNAPRSSQQEDLGDSRDDAKKDADVPPVEVKESDPKGGGSGKVGDRQLARQRPAKPSSSRLTTRGMGCHG